MGNHMYVYAYRGGKALPMSNGVRLLWGGRESDNPIDLTIRVRGEKDALNVAARYPGLHPEWGGVWNHSQTTIVNSPTTILNAMTLQKVAEASLPFHGLSSSHVYWIPDPKHGTHVLRDVEIGKTQYVSPAYPEKERAPFWRPLFEAASNAGESLNVWKERLGDDFEPPRASWHELGLYDAVYFCLHPAPRTDRELAWTFNGKAIVRFDMTLPPEFERTACENEIDYLE